MLWHQDKLQKEVVELRIEIPIDRRFTAKNIEDLSVPMPKLPTRSDSLPQLAHTVQYTWRVRPPTLSPKSREIFQPLEANSDKNIKRSYSPPVFRELSGRVVVAIRSREELLRAKELMKRVKAKAIVFNTN